MRFVCSTCNYQTNRKWSYEDHISRPMACQKRLNKHNSDIVDQNITSKEQSHAKTCKEVFTCKECKKDLSSKKSLQRHYKTCRGINTLQCPTCREVFGDRHAKHRHIKKGRCIPYEDEKVKRIKELEAELEAEKQKRKEAEERPTNITINNNFNGDINYNNFNSPYVDHINYKRTIKSYHDNKRSLPITFIAVRNMIEELPENRSVILPEGQKANYCRAIVNSISQRVPTKHILPTLISTTAEKMFHDFQIAKDEELIYGPKVESDIEILDKLSTMELEGDDETVEYQELRKEYIDCIKQALLSSFESHFSSCKL